MDGIQGVKEQREMLAFNIRHDASRLAPRVGEILLRGYPAIPTPSLIVSASRGAVPHVTQDLVQKHTAISAVYNGLEDFLEKNSTQNAPILGIAQNISAERSPLRTYTALPDQVLSILGPRRVPMLNTPQQSTSEHLAISTSFGFSHLDIVDYNEAIRRLKPDVSTTIVDLVQADKISKNRLEKSADRTHAWLRDTLLEVEEYGTTTPQFASIPPLEPEQQSFYLADLADEFRHHLSGVCIYEPSTAPAIPSALSKLPVLCLSSPKGPHDVLRAVSLGIDLVTTPFVTVNSEAGIALTFKFAPPADVTDVPLGFDLWSTVHATDTSPLAPSCPCYTCTRHHRAYLHHLLQAREMLAWTLLQIHNFHVVNQFFEHIRLSILQGTFEDDNKTFRMSYQSEMPLQTGQGPRVRGYQTRSYGKGGPPNNAKAYNNLDERAEKIQEAESGIASPSPDNGAKTLETHGLGRRAD